MSNKLRKLLWQMVLFLLALTIAALAIKALYGLLQNISLSDIIDALTHIPLSNILFATVVVAVGYFILTLYDAIAFKHLQVKLPFKKVAFTSFTAYAIGHTVGLALLSASGVRYRMYRVNNIKAEHIANVIWLVSLAFTFGISTLVAVSLSLNPDATVVMMTQIDAQLHEVSAGLPDILKNTLVIRSFGLLMLVTIIAIVTWSGNAGRHVKIRGWRFDLPPAMILIKQIVISIVDLASVAFVLFILLPHDVGITYLNVFSAFVQSMILAILSHVPGGLGVFELTMIASLPQVEKPQLFAVLLVFRLLYYILPFLIALLFFIAHEIWLHSKARTQ